MKILILSLTVTFFIIALSLQSNLTAIRFSYSFDNPDCSWCENKSGDEITYLPLNTLSARLFSPADPGFLSDLIWMRTCYYFGAHAITDKQYDYLSFLLELITDLSPKWELPYTFGAISLFVEAESPFEAVSIIDKGLKHLPQVWELHFLGGYIAWKHFKDMESASISLLKASRVKGSPAYLASLSATLALKANNQDFIDIFNRAALEIIDNPQQRQVIQNKLRKMEADAHD